MKDQSSDQQEQEDIPPAEWVVASLGLILVCVCLGVLLFKAFKVDNTAPEISFNVEQIVAQNGGALVLAKVSNTGGKTVTGLEIKGSAGDEERDAEIDFLPARSSRKFGMFFSSVPSKESVHFSAGGYQQP